MDFNVIVGEPRHPVLSEPEPTPGNPARDAARNELNAVMNDPAHPVHSSWKRGNTAVVDHHLKPFYEKVVAESPPGPITRTSVSVGPVELQEGETHEAAEIRARNEVIFAPLKQEWGPHYERRVAAAQAGVRTMFEDKWDVFDELGEHVRMTYGPKGEAAVLKLFAELEDIKQGG